MRRVLLTGGSGLLGHAVRERWPSDWQCLWTYHTQAPDCDAGAGVRLDVSSASEVRALFERYRPDLVLHTAATMDAALLEPVVIEGTRHVAAAAVETGARLLYVSTDMVFDGLEPPYAEGAPLTPVHPYGDAKARAEEEALTIAPQAAVVRSSLLYRLVPPDPRTQRDLDALLGDRPPTLFVDEVRCPAAVEDFADALLRAARAQLEDTAPPTRNGARVYHLVGPEPVTRRTFGTRLLRALGGDVSRLRFGTIAESGLVRPVDLTLETEGTPAAWLAPIRPFSQVIEEFEAEAAQP